MNIYGVKIAIKLSNFEPATFGLIYAKRPVHFLFSEV